MVESVGGSSPAYRPGAGSASTGGQNLAVYNAMENLWALFAQETGQDQYASNGPYNAPHNWAMLQNAVNTLMSQWTTPPKDAASLAIYNDLAKVNIGGASGQTLAEMASGTPEQFITDMMNLESDPAMDLNDFLSLFSGRPGLGSDINTWFTAYYGGGGVKPSPAPPAGLQTALQTFQSDLAAWQANPFSTTAADAVVADITKISGLAGGSSDWSCQFLSNYLSSDFDTAGKTSLESICAAITKAGGSAKDMTDMETLYQALFVPPSTGQPAMNTDIQSGGWVGNMLQYNEF